MSKKKEELITFIIMILIFSITLLLIFAFLLKLIFSESAVSTVGAALISAGGSIIGGSLTLVGVIWTLKDNKKNVLNRQAVKTRYIFSRLNPYIFAVQNSIKSINPLTVTQQLNLLAENCRKITIEIDNIYRDMQDISDELLEVVTSIEYYTNYLSITIKEFKPGVTDQEIRFQLELLRNNFAKCEKGLGDLMVKAKSERKLE